MAVRPSDVGATRTLLSSRVTKLLSSWNGVRRQIFENIHSTRQVTLPVERTSSAAARDLHLASSFMG